MVNLENHSYIDTSTVLAEICEKLKMQEWISFDTEFIGEKRFYTLLCLIQIDSPIGCFLIDPIKVPDLKPLLDIIQDPKVLKITHAGENDYRLFFQLYSVLPQNIFDTQIAAGFLNHSYPAAFRKVVDKELNVRLKKGFAVAEWDVRPLSSKHLQYALNDVIYLKPLHDKFYERLVKAKRIDWCEEEFLKMTCPASYETDIYAEAMNNNLILQLSKQEQVFMLRLYKWRIEEAKRKDHSKEMILSSKYINLIVKNIKQGESAMENNRLLPRNFFKKYGETFKIMFDSPIQPIETEVLAAIQNKEEYSQTEEINQDILYALVKHQCFNAGVSPNLLFSKASLRNFIDNPNWLEEEGWRAKILGKDLMSLCKRIEQLKLEIKEERVVLW